MQLSMMRRLRLLCGLLQHAALSFLWMRLNMLTFLHYFPQEASLDFLLFSYVFICLHAFHSEYHVLLPQPLSSLPIRPHSASKSKLGFHFSFSPPQISEHSFAIYGIVGLLLFHVSCVVNYLVSPVSPFNGSNSLRFCRIRWRNSTRRAIRFRSLAASVFRSLRIFYRMSAAFQTNSPLSESPTRFLSWVSTFPRCEG